jgi:hypothetical protein
MPGRCLRNPAASSGHSTACILGAMLIKVRGRVPNEMFWNWPSRASSLSGRRVQRGGCTPQAGH